MPQSYTTVDAVITQACHKLGDTGMRKYGQLLAHALTWFQADYNAESGQTIRTVRLDVGPDRTANLPDDYLDFVVVGRPYGDRIRTLAHNPKLSPLPATEPWLDRCALDAVPQDWWPCYEYAGWEGGTLCGYGWGEYREEFTIDLHERTLRLSSLLGTEEPLFFQYISNDLNPGKPTPLHPAYALSLEYWLLWQMALRPPAQNLSNAREYERLYYKAKARAKAQLDPFSYADLNAIIRQSYNQIR
jgi:hypothetical protein